MESTVDFLIALVKLIYVVMSDWNAISSTVVFVLFIAFMTWVNVVTKD
jgi:hypothetical protein